MSEAGSRQRVAVIGAGPYGLATAAHLRQAGLDASVFGSPMQFWRQHMPAGMLMRSRIRSCHIADPDERFGLDAFARTTGQGLREPLSLEQFVAYGAWFQSMTGPEPDARHVASVERLGGGFRLTLDDGEQRAVGSVVVAAGMGDSAFRPRPFATLPAEAASHTSELVDFGRFSGKQVLVVGGGQSALESAALLHEAGAQVEVVARQAALRWLPAGGGAPASRPWPLRQPPPTDIGGRLLGWLVAAPDLYRRLPRRVQAVTRRTYEPAGAGWLRKRLADVPITTGRAAVAAEAAGGQVRVRLDDGTQRTVCHVVLGTGYRPDVAAYRFLGRELLAQLDVQGGYPRLGSGLQSLVRGLYFVGAPATATFGPVQRFVVGAWYAAPAVTAQVLGQKQPPLRWSFPPSERVWLGQRPSRTTHRG